MTKEISEKKQRLWDEKNASPIKVGETVGVNKSLFGFAGKEDKIVSAVVTDIRGDVAFVKEKEFGCREVKEILLSEISHRDLFYIGANPFADDDLSIRFVSFTLESVLFGLGLIDHSFKTEYKTKSGEKIRHLNWNPFVIDLNGNTVRYQRPFVWSLEEKQYLIESIYQRIECGRILVRKRSCGEVEELSGEDCAWYDIIDGKQRLNAIYGFMNGEYPDLHGNYYADLSNQAQHYFTNHQLFAYAEMKENYRRYQGDIIRRSTGYVFEEKETWFSMGSQNDAKCYGYNYQPDDEIIGNIHEHPHLLNDKK